jgi:PAS domain S-box-containing protein
VKEKQTNPENDIEQLRLRLEEAQETLAAIRSGEADAIVVSGGDRPRVFTLESPDSPYRQIVETMNAGTVTLDESGTIHYTNRVLPQMLDLPPETLIGSSFLDLVDPHSREEFASLLETCRFEDCMGETTLITAAGTEVIVQVSGNSRATGEFLRTCLVVTDISRRVRAERELQKAHDELERRVEERTRSLADSEERYRTTVASIGDAVITADREGRISYLNRVAEDLTGWPREQSLGRPLNEIFTIIDEITREPAENPVVRATREDYVIGIANHTTLISRDGREIPIEDSAAPIKDAAGNVTGVVMVFHDVTQKRAAENALRASEAKYRNLFDTTEEMVAVYEVDRDDTGRIVERRLREGNRSFLRSAGVSSVDEIRGKTPDQIYGELWSEAHLAAIQKAMDTGYPQVQEVYHPESGRHHITTIVRLDEKTYLGTGRDITERKRLEEKLRASRDNLEMRIKERTAELVEAVDGIRSERQRFLDVLDTLPVILVIIRPDYTVEWTNRAYREALGDNAGLPCFAGQFGRDKPCEECEALTPLDTGRPHHWEWTVPSGRTFDIYNFPFVGEEGSPLILKMDVDITEQRQAEVERSQLAEQLRQAQKMEALGTLAGGIAHDFNNILAAIIGFAELLKDHAPRGSREAHHAQRVLDAGIRGRDLVRQMLTFSRQTEHKKKPLLLSGIVSQWMKLFRSSMPSTIALHVDIGSESGVITGDPVQIEQVLMNLCMNAGFAMRETGGTLDVEVSDFSVPPTNGLPHGMSPGPYVRLRVHDTGTGIPKEIQDKIFDPFFTTKEVGEGTGLGLSVVAGIVKHSNGYVAVESEPGRGTTFDVYFPAVPEDAATDREAADETIPRGNERILFIDDEEPLVDFGGDLLAELGYEVTCQTDSREALALFSLDPSRFDLVVTDQTMPGMTGTQLSKKLLALRPGMPVVLCTGFSHTANEESAREAGIRGFVMKPLTRRELARAVRRALDEKP